MISILFVICAMVLSMKYIYPEHPLCRGGLGAGFPVLFICDAGLGGSPISSWKKITLIDIPNGGIRPGGFLIDFLFYTALAGMVWFAASVFFQKGVQLRDLGWAAFISIIYIAGLLCGSLMFFSSELYIKGYARTPTSNPVIIPSATALGTLPALVTPVPTSGP